MSETCLNELGVEREALMADTTITAVTGDELAVEDQLYREMRAKLEAMGPVNMMALEEYKETAERHTFLETQRTDLITSIENTTATIKEIDQISRQKFEEAFHKINENFQATFKKLFGGGHAFMKLTDEENSAESGIDVVASPPGKRLQSVLLLSGGEKALTALALLVGIFQYAPTAMPTSDRRASVDDPGPANTCPPQFSQKRPRRSERIRPPTRLPDSRSTVSQCRSLHPAARPARPPPTMTTSFIGRTSFQQCTNILLIYLLNVDA